MKFHQLTLACAVGLALSAQAAIAEINVGVSLSTTGPGAALGIPEKNALAIMPTEIAGEKINYIVLDDATDPTAASKNARKLTSEDKVDVLIGSSVTPTSLAVTEVAIETKTPQISLAPTNLPAEKNTWVFRTPQHNDVMASALAEHMKAKGVKTLGFIGFSDAYGEDWLTALKKPLEEAGIKLDPIERYNRTDTSVTGQILKLTSAKTDAVLVVGSGSPAALPQLGLIERGYKGQVYQTHAAASPAFMKVAQKAAENVIMPIGPVVVVDQIPDDHPSKKAGQELTKQYNEKYGEKSFTSFAGHANDAFRLLEAAVPTALKAGKPGTPEFRQGLRDALEATKDVVGVHGVYTMTADNHFGLDNRGRVLIQVQGGEFKLIQPQ